MTSGPVRRGEGGDPVRNIIDTLTDVQGRRVEIWQDCDTIGVGDAQFDLTGFGAALATLGRAHSEAAAWAEEFRGDDGNEAEAALAAHETDGYDNDPDGASRDGSHLHR